MKAVRLHARGDVESLNYQDAPKPRTRENDALVRVYATGMRAHENPLCRVLVGSQTCFRRRRGDRARRNRVGVQSYCEGRCICLWPTKRSCVTMW